MRLKDSIGHYSWLVKEAIDSCSSCGGSDPMWLNPDSHPSALVEWKKKGDPCAPEFRVAELSQWQKVGRTIRTIVVARFNLSADGEWKAVPADAQPIQTR